MKKITQKSVLRRYYLKRKIEWLKSNVEEEMTGNVKFVDGIRFEESKSRGFIPFYRVNRFDSGIMIMGFAEARMKRGEVADFTDVLKPNEYFVVRGKRVTKN